MTAAPEFVVSASRGALYYAIGAFTAPQSRARELMAEPRLTSLAWQIVLFSAVISAGATSATDYLLGTGKSATTLLPAQYAFGEMLLWGAIACVIFVVSFFLTILLWSYLFGYRDQKQGLWAASAMASCPLIFLSPALSVGLSAAGEGVSVASAVGAAYTLVSALILAIYYRATLVISYVRAVCLLALNTLLFFVGLMVLVLVGALLFFLLSGSVTP